jgi:hypothetical protein
MFLNDTDFRILISHIPSERCFEFIRILAPRYPQTKFVSIIGNKCIANYPDRNLPTLILYRNGKLIDNLIAWGANEKAPGTIHRMFGRVAHDDDIPNQCL